jgi:uncharacterized LabA/DUF88 family protein
MGCRTEVLAFGPSSSAKLREEADEFVDMDKDKSRYLIKNKLSL